MARSVHMSRAGARVFAKKTKPSINSVRHMYIMRGGGYL